MKDTLIQNPQIEDVKETANGYSFKVKSWRYEIWQLEKKQTYILKDVFDNENEFDSLQDAIDFVLI